MTLDELRAAFDKADKWAKVHEDRQPYRDAAAYNWLRGYLIGDDPK